MKDAVEKTIEVKAARSRVWRALCNAKEFGTWFSVAHPFELVGDFVPGAQITWRAKIDGRDVQQHFCTIERVEPEHLLAFRWVPYEIEPGDDHTKHPTTRIEFRLSEVANGTRIDVVESGFAKLPADKQYKRDQNAEGWESQIHAIAQHVLGRITVEVHDRIARPVAEVLDAIVDPAKMSNYFVSRSSGRIEPKARLRWEWDDVGEKDDIEVHLVDASTVGFIWHATGTPTYVTLALAADGDGTKITATEVPFELTEEAAARAIGQTQGWTDFCCSLRAYLHHGINLRRGTRVS